MGNNQPLVSVGIPTFNRPESLKRALDCICQQSYKNIEIIVSDNDSPGSETKRVVEDYIQKDSRINYILQPSNLGPVANFQYVLNSSIGDYFMWMADDDFRAPTFIERLLIALQHDENSVLAFCDVAVRDENGNRRDDYSQSYLSYLENFNSPSRLARQVRFFMQDESYGKACLIYGLMRSNLIKSISLIEMHNAFGFYGLDNLVVYLLLGKGNLKLEKEALYECTAGNIKNYPGTTTKELNEKFHIFVTQIKYIVSYIKLSDSPVNVICTILLPCKIFLFYAFYIKRKLKIITSKFNVKYL